MSSNTLSRPLVPFFPVLSSIGLFFAGFCTIFREAYSRVDDVEPFGL